MSTASDTKERNFCFAYKGDPPQSAVFEDLHFQLAEGAYSREDGLWYVKVSLDRNHGRHAVNIPNVIEEYNELVEDSRKLHPVKITQMQSTVTCFKTTGPASKNHITNRISQDSKTNPTYWRWENSKPAARSKQSTKPTTPKKSKSTTSPNQNRVRRIGTRIKP